MFKRNNLKPVYLLIFKIFCNTHIATVEISISSVIINCKKCPFRSTEEKQKVEERSMKAQLYKGKTVNLLGL